jgi:hypothetical protein
VSRGGGIVSRGGGIVSRGGGIVSRGGFMCPALRPGFASCGPISCATSVGPIAGRVGIVWNGVAPSVLRLILIVVMVLLAGQFLISRRAVSDDDPRFATKRQQPGLASGRGHREQRHYQRPKAATWA